MGSYEKTLSLQKEWFSLVAYFIKKSSYIKALYWPGDLELSEEADCTNSSFGIDALKKHSSSISPKEDMQELICPINVETTSILLKEHNKFPSWVSPWFHIELLDTENNTILYSGDFGSDILVCLSDNDITALSDKGLMINNLIQLPEIV